MEARGFKGRTVHGVSVTPGAAAYDFLDKLFALLAVTVAVCALFLTVAYWAAIQARTEGRVAS